MSTTEPAARAQEPIRAVPAVPPEQEPQSDLDSPDLYFNRELSWLDFNDRVLQIAENSSVPLLERAKFCSIFTSNLDEFFMIRVAGLHDQVDAGLSDPLADGRTPSETIDEIRTRVSRHLDRLARCLEDLRPQLAERGIRIVSCSELTGRQRAVVAETF